MLNCTTFIFDSYEQKDTLTMTLSHKTCINISGQGFKKTLSAINVILHVMEPRVRLKRF